MTKFTTTKVTLCIALAILTGILVHDTKFDSFLKVAVVPVIAITAELTSHLMHSDSHTHVERVSVSSLKSQTSKLFNRRQIADRYMMQKNVPRGHHAFDNYNLPIVA